VPPWREGKIMPGGNVSVKGIKKRWKKVITVTRTSLRNRSARGAAILEIKGGEGRKR